MTSMHTHTRAQSSWIVILDLVCLVFSTLLAVSLRFGHEQLLAELSGRIDGWVLFFGSIIIANYLAGSYRVQYTLSRFDLLVTWIFSVTLAMFVLSVTSYASCFRLLVGRGVLFLAIALYGSISLLMRLVVCRSLFSSDFLLRRVAVIGSDELAQDIRNLLENPFILPHHRVVSWVELVEKRASDKSDTALYGIPVIESRLDELSDVVDALDVDLLVTAHVTGNEMVQLFSKLRRLRFSGIEILTPRIVMEIYRGKTPIDMLDEESLMHLGLDSGWPLVWRTKRIFDMTFAFLACFICLPILCLIALLIKIESPKSPVFYSQERVGRFGKIFRIHKFRTMREDAETETGAVWSAINDPRITIVGKILRKFRLDEIPQFWNILKGDMSLVGPRPERPDLVADLSKEIPFYRERENAMPGLTGWAQIRYPYGGSIEDAKRKLEYDLFYIKNFSISLDLQIVLRTLRVVIFGKEKAV